MNLTAPLNQEEQQLVDQVLDILVKLDTLDEQLADSLSGLAELVGQEFSILYYIFGILVAVCSAFIAREARPLILKYFTQRRG